MCVCMFVYGERKRRNTICLSIQSRERRMDTYTHMCVHVTLNLHVNVHMLYKYVPVYLCIYEEINFS